MDLFFKDTLEFQSAVGMILLVGSGIYMFGSKKGLTNKYLLSKFKIKKSDDIKIEDLLAIAHEVSVGIMHKQVFNFLQEQGLYVACLQINVCKSKDSILKTKPHLIQFFLP
jgi:hypothetical protein